MKDNEKYVLGLVVLVGWITVTCTVLQILFGGW